MTTVDTEAPLTIEELRLIREFRERMAEKDCRCKSCDCHGMKKGFQEAAEVIQFRMKNG